MEEREQPLYVVGDGFEAGTLSEIPSAYVLAATDNAEERRAAQVHVRQRDCGRCRFVKHLFSSLHSSLPPSISICEKLIELSSYSHPPSLPPSLHHHWQAFERYLVEKKLRVILDYLKQGWFKSSREWASAFRRHLPTWGHNTNNICEGNFFAAKFVIFYGVRAFNLFQLVCTISTRYDAHYSERIMGMVNQDFDMEVRTEDKTQEGRERKRQGGRNCKMPGMCVFVWVLMPRHDIDGSTLHPSIFIRHSASILPRSPPAQVFIKAQVRRHTKRWQKQDKKTSLDLHDAFRLYDVTPLQESSTLFIVKRKNFEKSDEVESEHLVDLEAGCCTCLRGGTRELCMHIYAILHHKAPAASSLVDKHAVNCSPEVKDLYLLIARGEHFMETKCWAWALPAGEQREAFLAMEAERAKKEIADRLLRKDAAEKEEQQRQDDTDMGGTDDGRTDDDAQPPPFKAPPSTAPLESPSGEPSPIKFNGELIYRNQFVAQPSLALVKRMKHLAQRAERKEYCGGAPLFPLAGQLLRPQFKDPDQRQTQIDRIDRVMELQEKAAKRLNKEYETGSKDGMGVLSEIAIRSALQGISTRGGYTGRTREMKTQKGGKNPLPQTKKQKRN